MTERIVLIIRHAEKPEPAAAAGVDEHGKPDPRSLTPRGWQRAGGWLMLFAPPPGPAACLPTPQAIYASAPESHEQVRESAEGSRSRRPLETITPLACRLGTDVEVNTRFAKGQESLLAQEISKREGVTLVCWQHEDIAAIATALRPAPAGVPAHWPSDRFNVVYRFDWERTNWIFTQIIPVMLNGDEPAPIQ